MKFVNFEFEGARSFGLLDGGHIIDLARHFDGQFPNLRSFVACDAWLDLAREARKAEPLCSVGDINWLPVIHNPPRIFCVGLNYHSHRNEMGREPTGHPVIFTRTRESQTGHNQPILLPRVSNMLDFEGELAVVLSKAGRYIDESRAFEHIAGYACYNDGTARDWQRHTHQWTPGKNFPSTGAFGPYLVDWVEFGEVGPQKIETRLNGETVQQAHLSDMIFSLPRLIAYLSSFTTLQPGDVIASGTPGGVGFKRTPQLFMNPGDRVEVEIEGIGVLSNSIEPENVSEVAPSRR